MNLFSCQSAPASGTELASEPAPTPSGPPRLLAASLYETMDNRVFVVATLSAPISLEQAGANGFRLEGEGAVPVADAYARSLMADPAERRGQSSAEILLVLESALSRGPALSLAHDAYGSAELDRSRLPEAPPALSPALRAALPEPWLPGRPGLVDLYWAAWAFMAEKVTSGDPEKGFEPSYIDEGFNENIYQWDSCFMSAYALYGRDALPAMAALDNFYNHIRADGYICRCYNEDTGKATGEGDINPPLFAWAELRYWQISGDASRLERVLPVLDSYYQWVKGFARGSSGGGLYWITDLGSGMDNSPRQAWVRKGAWVDLSSQQALAADCIAELAAVAGMAELEARYRTEHDALVILINDLLWSEEAGLYLDRKENGELHDRRTIASFWPLLAGAAPLDRAERLINEHLKNPAEFGTARPFPTLSASDPLFDPDGSYWRGGVWAPTTYMVIKGLSRYGSPFAHEAAMKHLSQMEAVFSRFEPAAHRRRMPTIYEPNIARNGDGKRQIWESYSPTEDAPGTRWDGRLLTRQRFCGWSGLGPVALLIEEVLGLNVRGAEGRLDWRPRLEEAQGISRLRVGRALVELKAEPLPGGGWSFSCSTDAPLRLVIHGQDGKVLWERDLAAGSFKDRIGR